MLGFFPLLDNTLLVYPAIGAIAGVLAGLLGIGGGLVLVPVLLWQFQSQGMDETVVMHLALGTSLTTIIATSVSSIVAHHKRGAVRWDIVSRLTPGILLGGLSGAWIARHMSTTMLQPVFAGFVILVAIRMLYHREIHAKRPLPQTTGMTIAGSVIGSLSAIVGIGGGTLTVPFLEWHKTPLVQAIATASACGFPIAVAGSLGFLINGWHHPALPTDSSGFIYWPAAFGIAITSMLFAPLGAKLAHNLPVVRLKRIFAALLFAVAGKLLFQAAA